MQSRKARCVIWPVGFVPSCPVMHVMWANRDIWQMFCEPDVTNEQCAVSPADRMMCRGAYLGILQHACENLDCCYDNRILNAPSCFPPKSGTLLEAFSSSKQCTKCTIFVAGIFPHPLLHFPTYAYRSHVQNLRCEPWRSWSLPWSISGHHAILLSRSGLLLRQQDFHWTCVFCCKRIGIYSDIYFWPWTKSTVVVVKDAYHNDYVLQRHI